MPERYLWALVLLAPLLWLFVTQLAQLAARYAGRRGGRRLAPRQALALLGLIAVLLAAVAQWWWPL